MKVSRTIDDICRDSSLSHFEVCRTLWAFRVIGLIRRVETPAVAAVDDVHEGLGSVLEGLGSVFAKE